MRIALMLRSLDEKGGVGIYSRFLLEKLISLDYQNTYLLFYKNESNIGKYSRYLNVEEYYLPVSNKFLWDQLAVPYMARRKNADVILNPKFSLPLITGKKCIVVQHGADWFIPEYSKFYKRADVFYNRLFMPLFCKKAEFVVSVSEFATQDFIKYLKVPPAKMRTIYFGPAEFFGRVSNEQELSAIRLKYKLPDKFILTLSRYGYGGGNRKNIKVMLEAYKKYFHSTSNPVKLVLGGKDVEKYITDFSLHNEEFINSVLFTGWIEHEDLPAIYSMAEIYLYPSNLETFPIPLTEAMTCGTPIITSDINGLKEIADDAALFVNNKDAGEIASAISELMSNSSLREELSRRGLNRSQKFNWNKCAVEILNLLNMLSTSSLLNNPSIELRK